MRISGYCHNSSTGIKLIILLLLILWGALIVAIPMFFVKGSNALLIAMYLQNIGMFILPAWIAATLFYRSPASGISDSHGVTGGVYKTRERIHRRILICDY